MGIQASVGGGPAGAYNFDVLNMVLGSDGLPTAWDIAILPGSSLPSGYPEMETDSDLLTPYYLLGNPYYGHTAVDSYNYGQMGDHRFAGFVGELPGGYWTVSPPVSTTVPEPCSLILLCSGLLGLAGFNLRKTLWG